MASIILSNTAGKTEEFRRPTHFDFMDALELKKAGFSGVRFNSISEDMEIWFNGRKEVVVTRADLELNPKAIENAWRKLLGLEGMPEVEVSLGKSGKF